jgi:hypothetical protein
LASIIGTQEKHKHLDRGFDYWINGAVDLVANSGNEWHAVVEGTQDYVVSVTRDTNCDVTEMTCTCPYAADGNNCKHMAAVLYALDSEEICDDEFNDEHEGCGDQKKDGSYERVNIEDVIKSLTVEQLQNELLHMVAKDPLIVSRLIAEYSVNESTGNNKSNHEDETEDWSDYIEAMRDRIHSIIYNYTDRSGFSDWCNCGRLVVALDTDVIRDLQDIVGRGEVSVPKVL